VLLSVGVAVVVVLIALVKESIAAKRRTASAVEAPADKVSVG
jgi:GABA permease